MITTHPITLPCGSKSDAIKQATKMSIKTRVSTAVEFVKRLSDAGFEDTHLLQRETAEKVLTEKRMELVREIATTEPESVRELARRVDRDVGRVSRDLDTLYKAEVIEYEQKGRAKQPVLAHENIFVWPVVYDGSVLEENVQK